MACLGKYFLWINFAHHSGESNGLADMPDARYPGDGALHPQPEPAVRHRTVAPQVQVPLIIRLVVPQLIDPA